MMNRIQTISGILVTLFTGLLIILPLTYIALWGFPDIDPIRSLLKTGYVSLNSHSLHWTQDTIHWDIKTRIMMMSSAFIGRAPLLIGLYTFRKIFIEYQQGRIFTSTNARHYKMVGLLCILDAFITGPMCELVATFGATFNNGPGHRIISISFGTENVETLLIGTMIIVVSWVMLQASLLQEEQEHTI